jgi:hypothetical protein
VRPAAQGHERRSRRREVTRASPEGGWRLSTRMLPYYSGAGATSPGARGRGPSSRVPRVFGRTARARASSSSGSETPRFGGEDSRGAEAHERIGRSARGNPTRS